MRIVRLDTLGLALLVMACAGCVDRTIRITSEPAGALVWLNDREVGRTPVNLDFVYYGDYDVRLQLDGYEPMMTSGQAKAPWWDIPGVDLGAELLPVTLRSDIAWHYELEPRNDDTIALVERARELRERAAVPVESADESE